MRSAPSEKAVAQLRWHYQNRHAAAQEYHRAGTLVTSITSNTAPRELVEAAGMFALLLSPPAFQGATAPSAQFLEPIFDARTRSIFDFVVSGNGDFLSLVVISRTSEPEHKLFLYLKEIRRQQPRSVPPDVYLYNLLHTRSAEARAYSWDRTLDLKDRLERVAGRKITSDALRAAIKSNNEARTVARQLDALRHGADAKLFGSEALALLSARYFMNAGDYSRIAGEAVKEVEAREPLQGPRILIKGFPLDHPHLHLEIESHGALVFAEDDWWGSRSASSDINPQSDPLEAIFDHYYAEESSPRIVPVETADQFFREAAQQADGVIFYLPPDDDVIGWDYPRHHKHLDELGIPHLLIRTDAAWLARHDGAPHRAWDAQDERVLETERTRERIAGFISGLL